MGNLILDQLSNFWKKSSGTSNGWAISSKANSVYAENTRNDENWE